MSERVPGFVSRRLARRSFTGPVDFGRDWLVRFVDLHGFDRAVALAGQAFTTLIPLVIVSGAVVSAADGRDFADRLIDAFHLSGNAADALHRAFAPAGDVESQIGALGAMLVLFSALSFTRALQRLYQLAWGQPSLGLRAAKWGLAWLALALAVLAARPAILGGVHGVPRVVLSILLAGALWLVTPYVLLARRVPWRRLMPTAALTSLGMTALGLGSAIWMPRTVSKSAEQFGVIGVAFALLSWLVGGGLVLVAATAGGRVVEDRLEARRAERSSPPPAGDRDAPHAVALRRQPQPAAVDRRFR